MYGVLGEDRSDVDTLKVLIRMLADNSGIQIRRKGYSGGGELLRKGATQLRLFRELGCTRFVVCYDADGPDPTNHRQIVIEEVIRRSGVHGLRCVLIPVQEIEAWILADIKAVTSVFTGWIPSPIDNPERIRSPKEHLERLSRTSNGKPRYIHAAHNERLAQHLDLQIVAEKCASFRPLVAFVTQNEQNVP